MGRLGTGRPAASPRPDAARSPGAHRRALAALVLADVAFAYQQTAVVPVIPVIEREVGVSQAWGAWLLSGYLLVATVATPVLGRLADRRGRRTMLLLGLGFFLAGSVAAAAAPTPVLLLAARAVQGVGGAVFPLSLSIVREEFPRDRVGSATGVLTGAFGIGTALGFATAGALTEAVSWHLVFAVGAAVVALALPPVVRWVPSRPGPSGGALDVPGAVLLSAALALVLVGGSSRPAFLAAVFVIGCGAGLTISASGTLVTVTADRAHAGVSTSVNSTVRRVGGGLGGQASAAVLILAGSGRAGRLTAFGLAAAFALVSVPFAARVPLSSGGPGAGGGPPPDLGT